MNRIMAKLTVFFEDPFWVGVYERTDEDGYGVCKITFGAEPKDYEVYAFLLEHWRDLRFGAPVKDALPPERRLNPKRRQREAHKQLESAGAGTKAQQALQRMREETRTERKQLSREQREAEKERKFSLRQEKRKEKHRGH